MGSEKAVPSVQVKSQEVYIRGERAETTEEFLARGGKIEYVPVRSGEEIMEYMKEQGQKRSKQALSTSRPIKDKKEGP